MGLILGDECYECGAYQTTQGGRATGYCSNGHPWVAATYVVYGNFEGQDTSEHWADFSSLEQAQQYRDEQVALAKAAKHKLYLGISKQQA
jgi:hypothetical protein